MNPKLRRRIQALVKKTFPAKAAVRVMREIDNDFILPMLRLTARTKIRTEINGPSVYLYIGRRDFSFFSKSGVCYGTGTCLAKRGYG